MVLCPAGTFPYIIRPGDTLWRIAQRYNTDVNTIMYYNQGTDLSTNYIDQVICVPAAGTAGAQVQSSNFNKAMCDLKNLVRMLWEQHVYWTRLFIVSVVFGLPDTVLVTNRLLRNPKDLAASLRPLYGETIAAELENLFTSHLTIAAELVKAAKAGDSAAAADAERRWYQNADQIAAFLARINPYWSAQEWRGLLNDHLEMTKNEAVDFLQVNYADSISTFNRIEKQALKMADVMTEGILRQFPNRY